MKFRIYIFLAVFYLFGCVSVALGSVDFMPRADFSAEIGYYFFHKSKAFRQLFMFEAEWNTYLTLLSAGEKFSFHFDPKIIAGQSRSPYGLIFHPEDISYGLITYGEYKTNYFNCILGLDHSCFHGVDAKRHEPYYWNKIISGLRTENVRVTDYLDEILDSSDIPLKDRLSWSFIWSWYVREFFGLVNESKIMTPYIDNYHDFEIRAKAAVFARTNVVLSINGLTLLGIDVKKEFYCRQMIGVDADFKLRGFVSTLYALYYMDKNWFDSRDKLFELGVKFEK